MHYKKVQTVLRIAQLLALLYLGGMLVRAMKLLLFSLGRDPAS